MDFGVADATAKVGLSCGGKISVLVMAVSETGFPPHLWTSGVSFLRSDGRFVSASVNGHAQKLEKVSEASKLEGDEFLFAGSSTAVNNHRRGSYKPASRLNGYSNWF